MGFHLFYLVGQKREVRDRSLSLCPFSEVESSWGGFLGKPEIFLTKFQCLSCSSLTSQKRYVLSEIPGVARFSGFRGLNLRGAWETSWGLSKRMGINKTQQTSKILAMNIFQKTVCSFIFLYLKKWLIYTPADLTLEQIQIKKNQGILGSCVETSRNHIFYISKKEQSHGCEWVWGDAGIVPELNRSNWEIQEAGPLLVANGVQTL